LRNAIDTPDALLEPGRIPRQFQADDPSGPRLQIQALAGDISGQQHGRRALEEQLQLMPAQRGVLGSVQYRHWPREAQLPQNCVERISEFRKHHDRLRRATDQFNQPAHFTLFACALVCEYPQPSQPRSFLRQAQSGMHREPFALVSRDVV
jgi:hypothetical protein